jgi:hypothetical protein
MTIHINRFVERLQGFEARAAKDFIMPMSDAKGMHADITRVLLELETLRQAANNAQAEQVINLQVDGGSFKIYYISSHK